MATNTVVVGCKLANGIIMQVDDKAININGFNTAQIIGGHGITEDVDEEFWNAWVEKNKENSLYTGGFIFANKKIKDTQAEAVEKKDNDSKTEPLKPEGTPGIEKADNKNG